MPSGTEMCHKPAHPESHTNTKQNYMLTGYKQVVFIIFFRQPFLGWFFMGEWNG